MAHIAVVPPIRFINIDHPIGPNKVNDQDDVLVTKAFMKYLIDHRPDLQWTKLRLPNLAWPSAADPTLPTLFEMIKDYKTFKVVTSTFTPRPEEREWTLAGPSPNGRIIPHHEWPGVYPVITSTILALNSEVKGSVHRLT